jgi:tetratricopeptide (TPR) repeat protein
MARALATLYLQRGALAEAQHLRDQYVSLSREWELRALSASLESLVGRLRALSGFPVEGLALMEQVPTARFGPGAGRESLIYIGEAYVLLGRLEEARTVAERALASAREQDYRPGEASALRLVAEIIAVAERPAVDDAAARYREALALADELGMRPLVAHCHLGLGKLYRRKDKREPAREHFSTAATMYREMGMTYWLEKAEAELR